MKKILLFTLSIILLNSCSENYDIGLNLELNKDYSQETNLSAIIKQSYEGQDIKVEMSMTGMMNYHVASVNETDFDLEVSYKNLSMTMQMPNMNVAYNSEIPKEGDVFSNILSEMTGKSFFVKMNKAGKIISVTKIDEFFDETFKAFPEMDLATSEQMKMQLKDSYGEKAFKGNMEMVAAIFPEKPVAKGDTWEINTNLESTVKAEIKSVYTLDDITEDYYLISGVSTIISPENNQMENQGIKMNFTLTGAMTSQLKVDKNSGWIIEGDVEQTMNGMAQIEPSPANPQGIEYPIDMTNKMKVKGN